VGPVENILAGYDERLHTACDGTLWLATDRDVARLDGDAWTVQLTEFNDKIAGVDGDSRIWIISEDYTEISAWDGDAWEVYGADAGWTPITDFWYDYYADWGQCDPAGRFWLATTQDIRVFDGTRWTVFTSQDLGMGEVPDPEGCAPSFQMTILKSTGNVWIGECNWAEGTCGGQGARWFDGSVWHGNDSPASQGCVAALHEDSTGNVWLGVGNVLWRYAPASGSWTSFAPPEEAPFGYRFHGAVLALAADPFGRLWVTELICGPASCDAHALYYVQDGVWTLMPTGEEIPYVLDLRAVTDTAGTTWLFGDTIYRLAETGIEAVAYLVPRSAAVDTTGRIWFIDLPGMLCTIDVNR
jgi:ligand-binding sensor domain-containing protein